ncbi:MAG TPA: efflux RND transporter periplasmic adaptor subunit [Candidatus Paceibacterota bacterium]|nr:efflux RND transporter periplasmic adaptor subunit [Candidatus Paceibacterota bacterium]
MPHIRRFVTPPIIITAVTVIAVCSVALASALSNQHPSGSYVTPRMGSLVEEVDTTGSVKAAQTIDLGFQVSGRVSYAGPAVGTHVSAGTTLITLTSADLRASLEQAQAALQMQQANLSAIQAGARPEDIAVSQTAVTGAQASVSQAQQGVIAAAQDAYAKADDAIHNKVDQFMTNPRTVTPTLNFTMSDSQTQTSIVSGRTQMETLLSNWQNTLTALTNSSTVDTATLASTTRTNLQAVNAYLNTVATGLTEAIPNTSYPLATIQGYEANIAAARTNISTDITTMNTAQTALTTAQSALASAQSSLSLKQAPATSQAVQAQQAQVAAAQANVDAAQAQLAKTVIAAPIAGTITINNAQPGEIAVPGSPVISIISDTQFQFEAYVSQADLAKLKTGDPAQVELDAYESGEPLAAHVVTIDPAATIQNGTAAYKVTLQFDQNDPRIQAGLTGSVKITTQTKDNAMSVPTSAIITRGTDHFVLVKGVSGDSEVPVTTGISSADGYTEIVSGIQPTDQVRSFGTEQ